LYQKASRADSGYRLPFFQGVKEVCLRHDGPVIHPGEIPCRQSGLALVTPITILEGKSEPPIGMPVNCRMAGTDVSALWLNDETAPFVDYVLSCLVKIGPGGRPRTPDPYVVGAFHTAAASIEQTPDNCVLKTGWANSGRGGRIDPNHSPMGHLRALQTARVYIDADYDVPFSHDSAKVLSLAEPLQKEYCSPDLRSLQERTPQGD
jgi:hypothetical protein